MDGDVVQIAIDNDCSLWDLISVNQRLTPVAYESSSWTQNLGDKNPTTIKV